MFKDCTCSSVSSVLFFFRRSIISPAALLVKCPAPPSSQAESSFHKCKYKIFAISTVVFPLPALAFTIRIIFICHCFHLIEFNQFHFFLKIHSCHLKFIFVSSFLTCLLSFFRSMSSSVRTTISISCGHTAWGIFNMFLILFAFSGIFSQSS